MLDLVGVFAFALSGCAVAVRARMDLVGLVALGTVTGLAGGMVRDVLLGAVPPLALTDGRYLLVTVLAALVVLVSPRVGEGAWQPVQLFDAVGLGLFAAAGAGRAIEAGVAAPGVVLVGTISAVGGGLLRDLLADRVPQVFVAGSRLYTIPAVLAALLVVAGDRLGAEADLVQPAAAAACTGLRLVALRRGWHAPLPRRS